jgi:hypothetical protein
VTRFEEAQMSEQKMAQKVAEPKIYYVSGKDWYGCPRVVKVHAFSPADARYRSEFVLVKGGKVRCG